MRKKEKFLAIDTETAGSIGRPLVYDIGYKVFDLDGRTYEQGSLVIYDIYSQKDLMSSAYYAEKIPQYQKDIDEKKRRLVRFRTAWDIIRKLMSKYEITKVCAYNTAFDRKALNNTLEKVMDYKYHFFFPKGTEYIDIWNMACSSIFQTRTFYQMAYENNWYSESGNVRTNAEVAYQYITHKLDFEEAHTALEDVEIEQTIMLYCWRKTKSENRGILYNPWRKPQKEWYYYEAHKDGVI